MVNKTFILLIFNSNFTHFYPETDFYVNLNKLNEVFHEVNNVDKEHKSFTRKSSDGTPVETYEITPEDEGTFYFLASESLKSIFGRRYWRAKLDLPTATSVYKLCQSFIDALIYKMNKKDYSVQFYFRFTSY